MVTQTDESFQLEFDNGKVSTSLPLGTSLTITPPKEPLALGFFRVGSGVKIGVYKSINLISILLDLKAVEKHCFGLILENYNYKRHRSYVDKRNFTTEQRNQFSKGFRELHKRGLVKRDGKFTYMVNPLALIPSNNLEQELAYWANLP